MWPASIRATFAPCCLRSSAVVRPVMPPPITATSTVTSPARAGYVVSGVVPTQSEGFRSFRLPTMHLLSPDRRSEQEIPASCGPPMDEEARLRPRIRGAAWPQVKTRGSTYEVAPGLEREKTTMSSLARRTETPNSGGKGALTL